jgi:ribose transport system ATP-binding protein
MQSAAPAILRCTRLRRTYPGVVALDDLDFSGEAGVVHAILGENGAGKSTFIKALGGTVRLEAGEIEIAGSPARIASVADARRLGISVAYQELSLIPHLTVGQNVWLNQLGRPLLGILGQAETTRRTEELFARVGAPPVNPRRKVADLSIAQRHVVEIVASCALNPRVLVLDEATAALPAAEAEWALGLARRLATDGSLVLFISHRLHECRDVAERFTVLRRGKAIRSGALSDFTDDQIVEDMLGRKPRMLYPPPERPPAERVTLEVRALGVAHELADLSFDLREGEIVGLGGLEGQGQSALLLALFGMKRWQGAVSVAGRQVRVRSPSDAFRAGIALVPEDRRYQGLHLDASIRRNVALPVLSRISRLGFLAPGADRAVVSRAIEGLAVKATSLDQPVRTLSGGNQQKVVVAKLLAVGAKVLLFHDLTRGIDVGAKAEIFLLMRRLAGEGKSILFYSSENQELVSMCDRVLVLRAGRLAAVLAGGDLSEERILHAALGVGSEAA